MLSRNQIRAMVPVVKEMINVKTFAISYYAAFTCPGKSKGVLFAKNGITRKFRTGDAAMKSAVASIKRAHKVWLSVIGK